MLSSCNKGTRLYDMYFKLKNLNNINLKFNFLSYCLIRCTHRNDDSVVVFYCFVEL